MWILDRNPKDHLAEPPKTGNLIAMATSRVELQSNLEETDLWHRRMGHIGQIPLSNLKDNVEGISLPRGMTFEAGSVCHECQLASQKQKVSRTPKWRGESPFDVIHMDLMMYPKGYNGDTILFHFMCSYALFHWVFTLPSKGTSYLMHCVEYVANAVKIWGYTTRIYYLDREAGLTQLETGPFMTFYHKRGVLAERTLVGNKEANGIIKHRGDVIAIQMRALTFKENLPQEL